MGVRTIMIVKDKRDPKDHINASYNSLAITRKTNLEGVVSGIVHRAIMGSLITSQSGSLNNEFSVPVYAFIPSINYEVIPERSEISFLKRLGNLPDDWTNGNPKKPIKDTIIQAIEFIEIFDSKVRDSFFENNIKIIPGPLVTGGTSLDFIADINNSLIVSVHNSGLVTFEACVNGDYLDPITSSLDDPELVDIFQDTLTRVLF